MDASVLIPAAVGFCAALLTLPIQTMAANSRAMKTLTQVYGDTINRLKDDVRDLKKEVADMAIEANRWKMLRCDNIHCKNRIPPKQNIEHEQS